MTTAATIIADAFIELGIIGPSESVQTSDQAMALRKLNQILQRWSNSPLVFPTLREISFPLTGLQSYTVGPSGVVSALRPLAVRAASSIDANGVECVAQLLPRDEWDSIELKALAGGPPIYVWYEATEINGTVHVYPQSSGYTMKLDCQVLLAVFDGSTSLVTLPAGYESALTLTLADDLAAAFGTKVSQDTRRRCAAAMAAIKATNTAPSYLGISIGGERFSIERGF